MTDRPMIRTTANRRTFLRGAGGLATVGVLAGCTGGDGGGGDGDGGGGDGGDGGGDGGDGGDGGGATTTQDPAANYPSGDIEFIVPYPTGGGFDAYARLMKPYLEEELGTTVTVRNVSGGGGVIGGTQAYNADPDGHTLFIWDTIIPTSLQIGRDDVAFDIREMSHVGYVTQSPNATTLMNPVEMDATWDAFVDNIPDRNWATQGRGTVAHTGPILMGNLTGAFTQDDLNYVHYGGTGPALGGLEKGEADAFMVGTSTSAAKVVQALDAQMFMVHATSDHTIADYMSDQDVDVKIWGGDLDVSGMQEFNELTVFRRFLTGPPGVPDSIQQVQIDAFDAVVNNDQFLSEANEAGRPLINPAAGAQPVGDALGNAFDTLNSSPYQGILQDSLGG